MKNWPNQSFHGSHLELSWFQMLISWLFSESLIQICVVGNKYTLTSSLQGEAFKTRRYSLFSSPKNFNLLSFWLFSLPCYFYRGHKRASNWVRPVCWRSRASSSQSFGTGLVNNNKHFKFSDLHVFWRDSLRCQCASELRKHVTDDSQLLSHQRFGPIPVKITELLQTDVQTEPYCFLFTGSLFCFCLLPLEVSWVWGSFLSELLNCVQRAEKLGSAKRAQSAEGSLTSLRSVFHSCTSSDWTKTLFTFRFIFILKRITGLFRSIK